MASDFGWRPCRSPKPQQTPHEAHEHPDGCTALRVRLSAQLLMLPSLRQRTTTHLSHMASPRDASARAPLDDFATYPSTSPLRNTQRYLRLTAAPEACGWISESASSGRLGNPSVRRTSGSAHRRRRITLTLPKAFAKASLNIINNTTLLDAIIPHQIAMYRFR